jgi:hypothetical protein
MIRLLIVFNQELAYQKQVFSKSLYLLQIQMYCLRTTDNTDITLRTILCWHLPIVWSIFDIHDVSGVGSSPIFR